VPGDWLWIPVTIGAAFAQTLRNAAQRQLTGSLGTLGATLVRFLYGLPFAALWLLAVRAVGDSPLPPLSAPFAGWVLLGAVSQIAATALLLRAIAERNFTLGVAYSKSEIIQVAVFGFAFLGDPVGLAAGAAIAAGTLGVLLLSPADPQRPFRSLIAGMHSRAALLGLASGTGFALSAIGYRGAALSLPDTGFLMAAACTLMAAQVIQTALLGGWLLLRQLPTFIKVLQAWRASLFAGLMGATASAGWFTAMAIEPAAHVRTLGLIELVFSYLLSRRLFSEQLNRRETGALVLLGLGLVMVTLSR
jgi:drug/metabolite transporter (DMT)-like permease